MSVHRPLSTKTALSKRLLFPSLSSSELPPLFLTADTPQELETEVYDFFALALRAFVNPWWTKISRYDKEFLPEITRILTHVAQALEARVLAADLAPLVFRDIPTIVIQHYRDYRNAASKLSTSYASGGALALPQLFHQLQPHIAVSADGDIDPEYMRMLIDHLLKVCLPSEDYGPESERLIVREIILKIVLKDVVPKISQPWFIQRIVLDQLGHQPRPEPRSPVQPSNPPPPFSFHTIIVVVLSAIQSVSGACLALVHAYKQAMSTVKLVNQSISHKQPSSSPPPQSIPSSSNFSPVSHYPTSDPLSVNSSPVPSRSSSTSSPPKSPIFPSVFPPPQTTLPAYDDFSQNYAQSPILLVAEIFTMDERYASGTIISTLAMLASSFTPFLDKLLPYLLTNIISAAFLFNVVRTAKRTLFPNGYPAPAPIDPTPEEQAEIRAKLVAWRGKGASSHLLPLLLGPDPTTTLSAAIDPLSSIPCNVHLVVVILDRVLGTLFPEMVQGGDGAQE